MNRYEERQERRRERLEQRAEAAEKEAQRRFETADTMAKSIPFGQPILVGHHSEKGDRAFRNRIHTNMGKGVEATQKAGHYRQKAESVGKGGISSDDPDAIEKLEAKVEQLQQKQESMKAVNRAVKKNDIDALRAMGLSDATIEKLKTPDWSGDIGYPSWALQNNNANIRRIKQRIEALKRQAHDRSQSIHIGETEIVDSVEDNRIQIFFPGKPAAELRTKLKQFGFRWAPSVGAWQAFRHPARFNLAREIVEGKI